MIGSVLVILPHNPGDVVMALQAIGRLKAEAPRLEFDYLVGEECRALVEGSPVIRRVHVIPKRLLKECWNRDEIEGALERMDRFIRELSAAHYDLSLNLFQERSGGFLQALLSADRKAGLELVEGRHFRIESRYLEHLAAIPASRRDNAWHAVDIYIRAARRALRELDPAKPSGSFPPASRRNHASMQVLPKLSRPDACGDLIAGGYFVFHPGSAWAGKRWPEEHWSDLASACHRAGSLMVFTGATEERPIMDRILARVDPDARGGLIDCVGKTDLIGAAWLLAHARLVVTGDTVAMHLAAAAGTPTLSLFGASNPIETGPYGPGHTVLQTDPDPLPDLAFAHEHPGLRGLRPESVAGFLLEGKLPEGVLAWQTDWDEAMDMQILRNARLDPHPSGSRAQGLMRALDQDESAAAVPIGSTSMAGAPLDGAPPLTGSRAGALAAIVSALARPDIQALADLEKAERALAEETRDNLVWEAYRIAGNGLPFKDMARHLGLLKARFEKAFHEERLAAR